jgi:hypothetical protein
MAIVEDFSETRYRYGSLPSGTNSLRLLTLLSHSGSRDIVCELTTYLWDLETGIIGDPVPQNDGFVVDEVPGSEAAKNLLEGSRRKILHPNPVYKAG